jgi:cell division transport system ATP-binding protein
MIAAPDSETPARVIEFTNVGLRYGHGPEILRDLSFRIEPGSFHFLTGPSGSGKTSLLRLLLLSLKPTSGSLRMFGRDVSNLDQDALLDMRRHIGIVFQEFRLLDHLTTFENVALPLRVLGQPESAYRENVRELLEWVGLGERMEALPPLLSGGEKQRAAIARAVIGRPDVLLADEPTGNVDPELSLRLVRLFEELNKLGTTIILATHELPLLDAFDFPHMSLKDGQVVING